MPKRHTSNRQDRIVITDRWKAKGRQEGKRWMVRAWDARQRRYLQQSFDDEIAGKAWADKKVAELHLGMDTAVAATLEGIGPLYLLHLSQRERSERHVQQVKRTLERLREAGINDLRDERLPAQMEHWLHLLSQERRGCGQRAASASHRNHLLRIAKGVTRFAVRRRMLPYNLLDVVDPLPAPKPMKQVYSVAELQRVLAPKREGDDLFTYFALMIYLGCRPSEAKNLLWSNLSWEADTITIPAGIKGNKLAREYVVPMQPELRHILQARARVGNVPIIPERYANAPSHHGLFKAVKRYLLDCGIEPRKMMRHAFRHTCASLLTAIGIPWPEARALLNHEDLRVSADYARCSLNFRQEVKDWPRDSSFWVRRKVPLLHRPEEGSSNMQQRSGL